LLQSLTNFIMSWKAIFIITIIVNLVLQMRRSMQKLRKQLQTTWPSLMMQQRRRRKKTGTKKKSSRMKKKMSRMKMKVRKA